MDTTTGELRKVHIFTTTLGFSSLVYAEIFPDEKLPHFITGTVHALSYYGAVPKYLVPDNLRTAVTRHSKDELVLQSAFSDLETFYDTIILPPPPRKPKGKPTVENHVRFLEYTIQTNASGTRSMEISEENLQTIEKYALFQHLIDSNGIVDEFCPIFSNLIRKDGTNFAFYLFLQEQIVRVRHILHYRIPAFCRFRV